MKDNMFRDNEFRSKLKKLTLPIAFQSLMLAAVAAADTFMLGNVEQNSMSAVGLATQIQFIQNMLLMAATSATGILGAQYWGKGDRRTVQDVLGLALKVAGSISLIFFVGCVFFPGLLMSIFTNEDVLVDLGCRYLRLAGWSYLFTGISQCYLAVMKVSEHTDRTAQVSVTTVLVNILLNAVFIYGWFGIPRMDVRGAALATLIARAIEVVWAVGISYRPGYLRIDRKSFFGGNRLLRKDFFKCFMPLLGSCAVWGVGFALYPAFMGHLGTDAAAGNTVASVVRDLVCCANNGVSAAGGIMVGNELGAGRLDRGKLYGDRLMRLSFLIGIVSMLVMLALTPPLLSFVKLTEGARHDLIWMMVIMSVYMIGRSFNTVVISGVFAAGGDTLFDFYSVIVTMWCIAIPLAAGGTFLFGWSPLVVYAMTCLDEVGKIPWVLYHFRKYKWVKDLTRERDQTA